MLKPTDPEGDTEVPLRGVDPLELLVSMGIMTLNHQATYTPLTGGVSSDIWLVHNGLESIVLKRAKNRLNVSSTWVVPPNRGQAEVNWLRLVSEMFPDNVPHVIAFDPETFAIALPYLDPNNHTNWQKDLMAAQVEPEFADDLGRLLAEIHKNTFARPELAADFDNEDLFHLLRIEPFLERSASAVPEVADAMERVIHSLRVNRHALVHGDFSPKNILVNRSGNRPRPVVLDAECAVWGDPVFDVAFCLAHLALKSIHVRDSSETIIEAARRFRASYLKACPEELAQGVNQRLGQLVPALLLARVVGASPVGYLTKQEQNLVTQAATHSLISGEPCGPQLHKQTALKDSPW